MKRRMMLLLMPVFLLVAIGLTLAFTLVGRGGSDRVATEGDLEFPEYVHQSARVERGYRLAVDFPRLFAQVPCYCGCGLLSDDPHRYLLDCFMNDDGSFDPHASGCTVCLDIADDAVAWQAQGKNSAEIQSLVDEKYESYGPPTSP